MLLKGGPQRLFHRDICFRNAKENSVVIRITSVGLRMGLGGLRNVQSKRNARP